MTSSKPKFEPANISHNHSDTFTRLFEKIESGEKVLKLSGLKGSFKFYIVSVLAKRLERPILYVVSSREIGESAAEDIAFYSGEKPPLLLKKELSSKGVLFSSLSTEMSERISWLYFAKEKRILLVEAPALLERRIPRDVLQNSAIQIQKGSEVARDNLILNLTQMGYVRTEFVEKVGELSLRGAILDLFSPGVSNPIRLELFGDEIGSIRYFSIDDQKSTEKIESVTILPVGEVILADETIKQSLAYIRKKAEEQETPASAKLSLLEEIEKGERFSEIEWLLPSFYPNLSNVFDYLSSDTLIMFDDYHEVSKSIQSSINSLSETKSLLKKRIKIIPDIAELYITENQLEDETSGFQRIFLEDIEILEEGAERIRFDMERISIQKEGDFNSPFEVLSEKILAWLTLGFSVQLVLQTQIESKKIKKILSERGIENIQIHTSALSSGFVFHEGRIAIIAEEEIFGERKKLKPARTTDIPSVFITSFSELKPGDYIVHLDFGIGTFRGLKRLKFEDVEADFLECEYEGGDKIYVPVDRLKLVQRYVGNEKRPKIDRLGHQHWKKVVKSVKKAVEGIAKELLELYAWRNAEKGFQFSGRDNLFREFEFAFLYDETPDQEAAIEDVMSDMEAARVMDRLICGDVGFGKTEVAIRAAFKAVMDGKQVGVLVPTTLLAYQHYQTFTERLKGYPVFMDTLSRFRTHKQEKETLKKLEDGSVDIIIGTHKLLGNKVRFKDLGLLVVDEEHRFGVSHKERLRSLKKNIDILTLSATPIPRTLQLSLAGIRDISLINTPPEGRQSVETYVSQFSGDLIQDIISRELKRNGAVFFIHNRIKDIFRIAEEIRKLAPEAKIDITHGRMEEKKLEKSISKFIEGKTNVLITTTIVEAGLDIPRANTIIVNDAHTFGLADLYQLRGRVGRSQKKAYAYFLVPSLSSFTPDAKRRLKAISELSELGSGFKLALSDLEIRGAGNIFGTEQSGHIADVGLELYLEMLNKAIKELKNEEDQIEYEPEIKLNISAFLPDNYISEGAERLLFYKKISSISSEKELREINNELKDRFGELPEPVLNLLKVVELKLIMKEFLVQKIETKGEETVIMFLQKSPFYHRFAPSGVFRIFHKHGKVLDTIMKKLKELIQSGDIRDKTNKTKNFNSQEAHR
jgi:transcription-repair coupling factor (superfamily II helicase)